MNGVLPTSRALRRNTDVKTHHSLSLLPRVHLLTTINTYYNTIIPALLITSVESPGHIAADHHGRAGVLD